MPGRVVCHGQWTSRTGVSSRASPQVQLPNPQRAGIWEGSEPAEGRPHVARTTLGRSRRAGISRPPSHCLHLRSGQSGWVLRLWMTQGRHRASRTRTTTTDRQTSLLAGSDRRALGVRYEAYPRVRCHRTLRTRGTRARRTVGGQGLCEGLDISLHEVVVLGLITCVGGRSRQLSPSPFRRSTQCYNCPQGCGRSAGGTARDWKRMRRGSGMEWRAQIRRVTFTACMDDMRDAHNSNLSHDVVCKSWRPEPDYWIMRTWDHACINSRVEVHVRCVSLCHWCRARFCHADAIPLMVTLSLVSCVLSLCFTTQTQYQV